MTMRRLQYCFALSLLQSTVVESFQPVHHRTLVSQRTSTWSDSPPIITALHATTNSGESELKVELTEYLKKRKEANADDAAKAEIGKVIGGTRGNVVLEYVSGSPNKQRVQDEVPDIFDYDELIKYGYANLATPIMENGGRRAMYQLMDLPEPATPKRLLKKKSAPKLVIDTTGETDGARYSGLKMSQVVDDDAMGRALDEAARKVREGESLRKRLVEEDYVIPYSDNPNKGPRQTPLWTPEMLDEAGKKAGEAQAWAKRARMGELKKDPFEMLSVEGELRVYSIVVAVTVALGYGNATPRALEMIGGSGDMFNLLQIPALALIVAGLGSAVANGVILAPPKRRSSFVWGVKGLMGGPLAVLQLRELDDLKTVGESEGQ
eukprot:CAMPEP_0201879360 /NCGR_PEP_ID=MMETSP0902-20130614/10260_1 /ASSEMBLY_ACC=CAM_ASM_000551 /TAXON_ID=420261 /ORGANISM="Thalassiosira antarctica, Strain CCMP982" /LENGTH=378 /DNA_ID=CAMNT_0048407161 /DNA_START=51 /DNA_END=1187 /DNA_ORIENTATION=+